MRSCRSLVVAFVLVVACVLGEALAGPVEEIVGTWRGTSACVDRQAALACTDEEVIYEIVVSPGRPDSVTVTADKVVDGSVCRWALSISLSKHRAAAGLRN